MECVSSHTPSTSVRVPGLPLPSTTIAGCTEQPFQRPVSAAIVAPEQHTHDTNCETIMDFPRNEAMLGANKPFPQDRPDLEIEGFTLPPEAYEDEIYLVPECTDELLPEDMTTVDGETLISPERSLLDLATCTTGADLWRMLDTALASRLVTVESLRQVAARHPHHDGSDRLTRFLDTWSGCEP